MAFVTVTNCDCHNFEFVTAVTRSGFFYCFLRKTDLVTVSFWLQMVTNSNVTDANLFLFLFRLKWFGMNEIRQNIPESEICFCFRFGIRIRTALTLINCTRRRTTSQSAGYPQAQIENHFQFLTASSAFVSCSISVLLEVKTNRSSAVLCFIVFPSAKIFLRPSFISPPVPPHGSQVSQPSWHTSSPGPFSP